MKIASSLIEALIAIVMVVAILPVAITQILGANLTGIYKTIFSVLAIAVVGGVVFSVYKLVMPGSGKR